ncbi:hypothetical protein AX16_010485 [Volvariella volvacea WC 439]|nr:hypothetical protein AX16_010485 [Volvariella volvacea WC 439]
MDYNRRMSTLPPHGSSIPVPSSIRKPPAPAGGGNRMSLAGPAMRAPYLAPPSHVPSTNPRQSLMRSSNLNPLLMSASKPVYGRTPLNNSVRRPSMWGGGGGVVPQPASNQPLKDTRPLRERPYQAKLRAEIVGYLNSLNYYDITPQMLNNVKAKEYQTIFNLLVQQIDPNIPLVPTHQSDEEYISILKALRYPFVQQLDTKWFALPGSPYSWPSLLGVLHWLMELCRLKASYEESNHPSLMNPDAVPEEFEDPLDHNALALDFYEKAYHIWLDSIDGVDDFSEPMQQLEARYERKNERARADLETKKEQLRAAQEELHNLQSTPAPRIKLEENNKALKRDNQKLPMVLQRLEAKLDKLVNEAAQLRAEIVLEEKALEESRAEHERLLRVVEEQNLTPDEVLEMNTQHETLTRTLAELRHKIAEANKQVRTQEVNFSNSAAEAETALDNYINLLTSLDLLPPLPAPFGDLDLTLDLNTATSVTTEMLQGPDIKAVIKPTLTTVASTKRTEKQKLESEKVEVEGEIDRLDADCESIDHDIVELERKIVNLNAEAEEIRLTAQEEAQIASNEATRLERELASAKAAALASGMGVTSRLAGLRVKYAEQTNKIKTLKEELIHLIIKNSHDIAMFKAEVSQHLLDLRDLAEAD